MKRDAKRSLFRPALLLLLLAILAACGASGTGSDPAPASKEASAAAKSSVLSETANATASAFSESEASPESSEASVVTVISCSSEKPPATEESSEAAKPETADPDQKLARKVESMTLEEKVGQMFLVHKPGEDAIEEASEYGFGGYLMFAADFDDMTRDEVLSEMTALRGAARIPLFLAVDEEGGYVNRLSSHPELREEPFRFQQEIYREGGLPALRADTAEKCEFLRSLGINLNLCPVCDVSTDPDDFIYDRTIGEDAETTAEAIGAIVTVMHESHVGSCLKHFPGYGPNVDTHTGVAYDERTMETFRDSDFLPFEAGIRAGADCVMVSHNIVECMDPDTPASLSPEVHRILREELGFQGVIITDDLTMEGVASYADEESVAVLAILAGNDLLCCSDYETQIPAVIAAVKGGRIPEEMIDQAVLRILRCKQNLGLFSQE